MSSSGYEGKRGPKGLVVYVTVDYQPGDPLRRLSPRTDLVKHTPRGAFECGFKGSGPSQLALAILADHLVDEGEAVDLHLRFRDRAIIDLPRDRAWRLTDGDIEGHLQALRASSQVAATH
jgi:hypothetical protein